MALKAGVFQTGAFPINWSSSKLTLLTAALNASPEDPSERDLYKLKVPVPSQCRKSILVLRLNKNFESLTVHLPQAPAPLFCIIKQPPKEYPPQLWSQQWW